MAVAELWETLKQAIFAYTGLSPVAFFTAIAVAAALYHVVSGLFAPPPPPPPRPREEPEAEPLPPPVQMGEVSEEELRQYDGSDPKKPLLMAIKGQIYDVSQSRSVPCTKTPRFFQLPDSTVAESVYHFLSIRSYTENGRH